MSHPDNPNFVYHVTTVDRAEKCLTEGIIPYHSTECSEVALTMDGEYDAKRPDWIADLGVSRLSSVYAHPDHENALERRNGGWLSRTQAKLAVLSIYVPDLSQAYVCDGLLNVSPPHSAEEYWSSFTTLELYRSQDNPVFMRPNNHPYSDRPTRFVYMWPEVLLTGGVAAERIILE
jgi:hypothetical protein